MSEETNQSTTDPELVELSGPQLAGIELLVTGKKKVEVAAVLNITPTTISRWFADPDFVAALNARRLDAYEATSERLRSMMGRATDVLESALSSSNPSEQLRAAAIVLKSVGLASLAAPSDAITPEGVRREQRQRDIVTAKVDDLLFGDDIRRAWDEMKRKEREAQETTVEE